jgi:hypothetical protein
VSLSKIVAGLGQSPTFVAFQAHMWFAFAVVYVPVSRWHWPLGLLIIGGILAAGFKEFSFDATQEKEPPQTFEDNLTDFTGYVAGIFLATVALLL